jgi:hypothetical protein
MAGCQFDVQKSWLNKKVVGMITNVYAPNRFIVVHLGGSGGFAEGCECTRQIKQGKNATEIGTMITSKNG